MLGRPREYGAALAVILLMTGAGWYLPLNYRALGNIYLLAVIGVSLRVAPGPALFSAVISALAWNFFYAPPRLSFSVLKVEDGLLLGIYFIVALIASQLASLRSLSAKAELLAESDRLHRTLLDSVSHELKTPVAVLRAAAEQLEGAESAQRQRLTGEILTAVHRMENVAGNLLNQSRLEAGAVRPALDWCDAADLIAAARRSVGDALRTCPIQIEIRPDTPLFFADAVLMEQVIANLLLNAAVHTPPGTPISVAAGCDARRSRVFIQVSDEGPGIPEGEQARIFEKFERGERAPPGGLGLGLPIVRGFMVAQGGDAHLFSRPGAGTAFTVWLPLAHCAAVPPL